MSRDRPPSDERPLSAVAHEVRNALFTMSANLDAFESEIAGNADLKELAEALRPSFARITTLVTKLAQRDAPVQDAERARLNQAVETAVADLTTTFDAVPWAMVLVDGLGRVMRLNDAARRETGAATFQEVLGRDIGALPGTLPWRDARALAERTRREGASRPERVDANGRSFTLTASPAGQDGRVVVVAQDITEPERLRQELSRMETRAAVGTLAAGFAHEVRNPLFAITATLDALQQAEGDARIVEALRTVRAETGRLADLAQDVLAFAGPAVLERSPASIGDVVARALDACAHEAQAAGVSIVVETTGPLPTLHVDAPLLSRVVASLVENGVQHSPAGARVRVRLEAAQGGGVVCEVLDDGPGVREIDLPLVFEPFFSRRRGGKGLSLAIARRVVVAHGGRVELANRVGGGAVATVRLPS
jgi:PAS domain S-box-containing protein